MTKRKTTAEFIHQAKLVHGDKYDYSKVQYINSRTKVLIVDSEFGDFYQLPDNHLKGFGNPIRSGNKKKTTEEFIKEAKKIHGNLYDYSETHYKNNSSKVKILDPEYGDFWQLPTAHLRGQGNPVRNGGVKYTTADFVRKARQIHGQLYDYSKVDYINAHSKVLIIDPEYGDFWQLPKHHLRGSHNPKRVGGVSYSQSEFIQKANQIHNSKYDYSLVQYENSQTPVKIIDPEYGVFKQTPSSHLIGSESPWRANIATSEKQQLTLDEFIAKAEVIHNHFYNYSKVEYKGYYEEITIIDPEFGEFKVKPSSHLKGTGHPNRAIFGFNPHLPAILYYLKVQNGKGYKIGITNRTVAERFVGENDKIEVIQTWYFESGLDAREKEQSILKENQNYIYKGDSLLSSGNTEIFDRDILSLDL